MIWHSKWIQFMQQGRNLGERDLAVKQEGYKIKIQLPQTDTHPETQGKLLTARPSKETE